MVLFGTRHMNSISELKKTQCHHQSSTRASSYFLSHNKPTAYLISVAKYEALIGQSNLGTRLANRLKRLGSDDKGF